MALQLSERVKRIKPSPTLAVTARAAQLKAAGKDIISLGAGEPDFDTPDHIKDAAMKAICDGFTKYTAVEGMPGLRQAVCEKFARENNLTYAPDQILVSCGGKQSFYNLVQALLNPGDEVIIPAPYWVSYPDMVLLADGIPIIISAGIDQNFKITPDQLRTAITPKTRLVVINSPSNPTGASYSREELGALAEVIRQFPQLMVATDDMYEHILWQEEPFANILNVAPDLYDRVIVLNGVSKAYSMTGWRIGYAGGPRTLIKAMTNVQSQSTSNPTSISQVAAQAALQGDQSCIKVMLRAFKERHDFVVSELNTIKGVKCITSQGTFYTLPSMQSLLDATQGISNDVELAEHFINLAGVALVPGSAFGAPGCMRLSYATSLDTLKQALQRIKSVVI